MSFDNSLFPADVVQAAADDLYAVQLGDGEPAWMPEGMKGLRGLRFGKLAARMVLPAKLIEWGRSLLGSMPPKDLIGEIKSYNSPPEVVRFVMQGVVLLIGRAKSLKECLEWKDARSHIDNSLVDECNRFDASTKGRKRQWVECRKANKDLRSEEVLKRGSAAVQVFQKWVEVCRLVRHFAEALRKEAEGEEESEEDRAAAAAAAAEEEE